MRTVKEVLESKFIQELIKDPKPTFLPYFKKEGPTITAENKAVVVETLMIDYLRKKMEILQQFKDYENKKSDIEVLQYFEKEVIENVGSRVSVMHFFMFDAKEEIGKQLEKVMSEEDFYEWAIT